MPTHDPNTILRPIAAAVAGAWGLLRRALRGMK